jgi:MoaA/NifB/PqqE/SkfB family radical SAM enzyme
MRAYRRAMSGQPRALTIASCSESGAGVRAPEAVMGIHNAVVSAKMWARVIRIAARVYRSPVRAGRALVRLRRAMKDWRSGEGSMRFVTVSGRYFGNLYMPGWPSKAFDTFVERELKRIDPVGAPPALQSVVMAITGRCALQCEHCVEWDALNKPESLTTQELHEIAGQVRQRGAGQLFFSGGEPMTRFDDLISLTAAAGRESDVWVITSGMGLTAEKARRLKEAGATGLAISVDHWDASAHDRFRGTPGSFEAARRAALHARNASLLVTLMLCPTRRFVTPDDLNRYGEMAREWNVNFIQILEPQQAGRYTGKDVRLAASSQEILEQFRLDSNRRAIRDTARPMVHYVDNSARAIGCGGAGDRAIYIDTAGNLHACPFCRAPGPRMLDQEFPDALDRLQATGCPRDCSHSTVPS